MSPPVKIGLIVIAAASYWIAVQPPNPPASKTDRVYHSKSFVHKRWFVTLVQAGSIGSLMVDCALLLSMHFSHPQTSWILSGVCASPSSSLANLAPISPLFMLGVGLLYAGAALRIWCFKTLGVLFTYEVTIRPDHKLITSGPYAFVRHPSYTGVVLLNTGVILKAFCPGSYVYECSIMSTPVGVIYAGWLATLGYTMVSLLARGKIEDEGLRKEFGVSWDYYSRSVPCRFIPGLV